MNTTAAIATKKQSNTKAIFIIGVLFFIFGFVTWLNGTLIPFLKLACQLKNDIQAFFVTSAFYMAYFFLAIPSSAILKRTGYKKGMALGLFVMAVGSIIFVPAAQTRNFSLFLTGLFVQATGLALLQTASNPYISIIGPIESAAQRISIMGICNKTAGMISPLILGAVVLKDATPLEIQINSTTDPVLKETLLQELASRVITPYIVITILLVILTLMIWYSSLPEIDTDKNGQASSTTVKNKTSVFQFPHLLLGVLCIFVYVGAEVLAGDAIGIYGRSEGLPLDVTRYFTAYTLLAMVIGYIVGVLTIPKIISQQRALKISAILGVILSVAIFLSHGYTSIVLIAMLGLANSLMWPAIFPLAIDGLGKFTKIGSAFLIMGIVGGAAIPLVYASLKDKLHLSNTFSFVVTILPCYLYIFYYALKGYKAGK